MTDSFSVEIKPDEDGLTGRECPKKDCEGYFKVKFGTGITVPDAPCHCAYCGHTASADEFWTREQIEYAQSVALRQISDMFYKALKKSEFKHRPQGAFGIGMSLKVTRGRPIPIRNYREKQLETEVVCSNCTLRYAVYGVFAYCPDCGRHNSLQILNKNLELAIKMLDFAAGAAVEVTDHLIANALEDCVSAFDGFGREECRVHSAKSTNAAKAQKVSFQNLEGARDSVKALFNLDVSTGLAAGEWSSAVRAFQKRHLVSHKSGVVDEEYIRKTGDRGAVVGRKISIEADQVRALVAILGRLGQAISIEFSRLP